MQLMLVAVLCIFSLNTLANEWSNESELSLLQTGGNTELETYNLKTQSTLKQEKRSYSLGGHYTLGSSEVEDPDDSTKTVRETTARNWDVNGKYEQVLSKKTNAFVAVKYEGDEFAGISQRENYDLGAKYKFTEKKEYNSFFELGYRFTVERTLERNEDDEDRFEDNKGRAYYELNRIVRAGFSYKFWVEYIYNFTRTEDYLINFEPSIAFSLNETFSVKLAYKGMYDNDPAAAANGQDRLETFDWIYTTALLAKF